MWTVQWRPCESLTIPLFLKTIYYISANLWLRFLYRLRGCPFCLWWRTEHVTENCKFWIWCLPFMNWKWVRCNCCFPIIETNSILFINNILLLFLTDHRPIADLRRWRWFCTVHNYCTVSPIWLFNKSSAFSRVSSLIFL